MSQLQPFPVLCGLYGIRIFVMSLWYEFGSDSSDPGGYAGD